MLPALIAIRAEFRQPQAHEKQGKAEWIKYQYMCCPRQNEYVDIQKLKIIMSELF